MHEPEPAAMLPLPRYSNPALPPLPPGAVRGAIVTAYPYRAEVISAWAVADRRRRNGKRLAALMRRRRFTVRALLALGWTTAAALAALFLS